MISYIAITIVAIVTALIVTTPVFMLQCGRFRILTAGEQDWKRCRSFPNGPADLLGGPSQTRRDREWGLERLKNSLLEIF